MTEFELKFEVSPANLKSVAVAMQQGKASRQRLQASYFDTADGALAAHGIVVRLRKEGRRWVQTAKGPTADLHERMEHNVSLPLQRAACMPLLDLSRHDDTPVGKVISKALALKASENYPDLVMLYGTDVQRITRRVVFGESQVEIALDQGCVFADGQSQALCELEVELKSGKPFDAVVLARQWCAAHGLWISTIAKSMKGQRLRVGPPFGAATAAISSKFSPCYSSAATGAEMANAVFSACLNQILPNMSELANGSKHPDHVHQLRVGIRRLRTALRELGELTNTLDPAWEAVLVRVFRVLGVYRDRTQLALMQPQLLAAGGPAIGSSVESIGMFDIGEILRAPDFQDTLLGLMALIHRDLPETVGRPADLKKVFSRRLAKLQLNALRKGKKFLSLDDAQQHSVRKRLKRLRYLMDFVEPLFTTRKLGHVAALLKPVQDALGLYNDELMALHAWRAMAVDDPNAWFGVGWLSARKQPNARRCLKEIKAFADVKPFWRK
jgi:triphosphatase